jgi:hypothetical protein
MLGVNMSHTFRQSMDFEQWRQLASQDPDRFEAKRREVIEALIDGASQRSQQRLRGLQWHIDQIRDHAPSPMAACISLSNMMWDAFAGEDGLAETLNTRVIRHEARTVEDRAAIIPFPERSE